MVVARARRPGLGDSLAAVWRTLRSMRTALILLLFLAAASIAGSLVPQVGVADARIRQTFIAHPLRAKVYERLGLFDVYGSWWFTLIYALLLVSLLACLIPRSRALIRGARARPQPVRELEGLRHYAERTVPGEPGPALDRARRVLRRRWFRVRGPRGRDSGSGNGNGAGNGGRNDATLAAEKGLAREAGSLLFHWSFLLLLVGVIYGKGTGFTGQSVIVEGQTWTEALASYDGVIREGRFFGGDHSGVQVHVRDFTVTYRPDTSPSDFVTTADLTDPSGRSRTVAIRVNHPAEMDGVRFYQLGYGWAPVIEVRDHDTLIASQPIVFVQSPAGPGQDPRALPWRGVVKLPSLRPQIGMELELFPDSRALALAIQTGKPVPMLQAVDPLIVYTAYRGDLHLTAAQNVSTLDTSGLEQFATGAVGQGKTVDLGEGVTISFPSLREYTVLQVARDRGIPVVLAAAILILLCLLPALYSSKRRLWIRAERDGSGTVLKVGGFALQRKAQFAEEFDRLVRDLEARPAERGS